MNHKIKLAFIGGTGLYDLDGMEKLDEYYPTTPWGKPSDKILLGRYGGKEVAFLPVMVGGILSPPQRSQTLPI